MGFLTIKRHVSFFCVKTSFKTNYCLFKATIPHNTHFAFKHHFKSAHFRLTVFPQPSNSNRIQISPKCSLTEDDDPSQRCLSFRRVWAGNEGKVYVDLQVLLFRHGTIRACACMVSNRLTDCFVSNKTNQHIWTGKL